MAHDDDNAAAAADDDDNDEEEEEEEAEMDNQGTFMVSSSIFVKACTMYV